MASDLRFDGKVVIVTGAGNGLGKSHALLFGSRGAKVVVNDLGGGHTGGGKSSAAADKVVEEIKAAGGEAVANYDSVEDGDKIVQCALDHFKGVHVVINNAGILRDVSFPKMTQEDWDLIYKVHVLGAFKVTHAAWPHLRDQGYGRVIFTASAAGIYGNFGQANYAMAKLGVVGMAQTLALEGAKKNVRVNAIAPIAGSRMTETVLPKEILDSLKPELVTPLVAYLAHESCEENGGLFEVGGGFFAKLRWERAEGKTFRLGRAVSPEAVKSSFSEITSFDKSTHPNNITASMQPIMANVQAGPSKGGNDLIDVDLALGYEMPEQTSKYDERDLAIYALGVGAAHDPLDKEDLHYVYEMGDGFQALPSFAVVPALNVIFKMAKEGKQAPGMHYGFDRILHGEQYLELKRPLPPHATLTHKAKIQNIFDKGRNAIVVTEITSSDETGEPLFVNEMTTLVRGAGGWGGDRGPQGDTNVPPERAPDASVTEKINDNQALLYRLSGDWNPLHVDPNFATAFGFQKPILHGLCTFGYAARAVLKNFSKGDGRYFKAIRVRFSESVFPGETLVTEMWKENDQKIIFRCKVKERDKVVISNASVELYKEIPVAKPKAKAAAPSANASSGASAEPNSADIFAGITKFVSKNPELAAKIQTSYLFKLSAPESNWVVDLKTGKGSVSAGGEKGDCVLELTDADFLAMCTGKADPQKLYFGGKLRISGNVMASQRLDFLKKVDPNDVMDAMKARVGTTAEPAAPTKADAQAATDSAAPTASDVFAAIGDHIARNGDLATKVANVFQFRLKNPDSVWTVDLKNGKGAVAEGDATAADCTLDMENSDFLDMTSGKADAQKLYFGGKLKISGNVMASQKLTFLKTMDPEAAKAAVAKHRAAGGGATKAAAPTAAKKINAPAVFEKLADRISKNAGLVKEVGAVIGFKITDPDSSFSVDLKNGAGGVKKEVTKDAAALITISDEDLGTLARGAESAQSLYQRGKLRLDGDAHLAARLGFLKDLG